MGSRLGKRKRLGVPDKSTEEKAERAAMEMEGTPQESPETHLAESLQSLMETTELKAKKRDQDPQIPANITEDQEGGEHAAISQEEILKASEQEISVAASLGASCELPQMLEPRSKTQTLQPLQSIVTAVDERGVQGEPKQSLSASETQGRKGEMALHSDCGPIGSEAVPSKEIFSLYPQQKRNWIPAMVAAPRTNEQSYSTAQVQDVSPKTSREAAVV
uniref:Uncharacterized protein n=1 Tax=Chrysemys picta bellii TaxID=8478 RepID=A0A8C3HZK3_CHRPI